MRTFLLAASASLLGLTAPAYAAMLRPFTEITAATVRLADLFDDLGNTPDRILGRAPAPGERILVGAPQLAAIARDFNVNWRPASGTEQAVIERRGDTLPHAAIMNALRLSLDAAGAPHASDIAMPDTQPIVIPFGSKPIVETSQCSYDPAGGHFTALLSVSPPDMPTVEVRLSGAVIVLARVAVPTHRLTRGAVITASDVESANVRANLLHGKAAVKPEQIQGMVLKHDVASGQPLTSLDVERPDLVLRGSLVHMSLNSEGIALAAEGIAKESGAQGDRILVENPTSHAIVEAQVVGRDAVMVAPRGTPFTLAAAQ